MDKENDPFIFHGHDFKIWIIMFYSVLLFARNYQTNWLFQRFHEALFSIKKRTGLIDGSSLKSHFSLTLVWSHSIQSFLRYGGGERWGGGGRVGGGGNGIGSFVVFFSFSSLRNTQWKRFFCGWLSLSMSTKSFLFGPPPTPPPPGGNGRLQSQNPPDSADMKCRAKSGRKNVDD